MKHDYYKLTRTITDEVAAVLTQVDAGEVDTFAEQILAEKVFIFAVGRVLLALQCLAKRLGHLGIDVQIVGSVTEKPITEHDLLILASGSGESMLPLEIARLAKKTRAKIGLITSAKVSSIKSLADVAVHLPCPTKNEPQRGVTSIQPMSTLFDQSLHLFGDTLCLIIQQKMGLEDAELRKRHANLE